MKIFLSISFVILTVASCGLKKPNNIFPNIYDATAQRGNSGRAEGNRWVIFQVKLLKAPSTLAADTIWINKIALPIELTRVGDTTFLNAYYYGMQMGADEPLVADKSYSGKARLLFTDKNEILEISKFRVIEPLSFP